MCAEDYLKRFQGRSKVLEWSMDPERHSGMAEV